MVTYKVNEFGGLKNCKDVQEKVRELFKSGIAKESITVIMEQGNIDVTTWQVTQALKRVKQ
ncbi:hypothetical protein HPMBJEAJ_00055 [Aeromonas phage avDM6]|nr:hypothetical protein HPMBJEAJ_00055 [Aeromonas phage avDM6]